MDAMAVLLIGVAVNLWHVLGMNEWIARWVLGDE
jgi:hypothetical protein